MAIQRQININPAHGTPAVRFDPDPLSARVFDQIFWTNNDATAHWPGLLNPVALNAHSEQRDRRASRHVAY